MTQARPRSLHARTRHWPHWLRLSVAVACFVIGVAGLVLPILPGWAFLFLGLAFLTTVSPRLRRAWYRFLRRHERVRNFLRPLRPRHRHPNVGIPKQPVE